jgi:hypothetical protein
MVRGSYADLGTFLEHYKNSAGQHVHVDLQLQLDLRILLIDPPQGVLDQNEYEWDAPSFTWKKSTLEHVLTPVTKHIKKAKNTGGVTCLIWSNPLTKQMMEFSTAFETSGFKDVSTYSWIKQGVGLNRNDSIGEAVELCLLAHYPRSTSCHWSFFNVSSSSSDSDNESESAMDIDSQASKPEEKKVYSANEFVNDVNKSTANWCIFPPDKLLKTGNGHSKKVVNPTQKPVELMKHFIKHHCGEKHTVLSLCSGTGTDAVAAIETNRRDRFIAFELDVDQYEIMVTRCTTVVSQMLRVPKSGKKKATHESGGQEHDGEEEQQQDDASGFEESTGPDICPVCVQPVELAGGTAAEVQEEQKQHTCSGDKCDRLLHANCRLVLSARLGSGLCDLTEEDKDKYLKAFNNKSYCSFHCVPGFLNKSLPTTVCQWFIPHKLEVLDRQVEEDIPYVPSTALKRQLSKIMNDSSRYAASTSSSGIIVAFQKDKIDELVDALSAVCQAGLQLIQQPSDSQEFHDATLSVDELLQSSRRGVDDAQPSNVSSMLPTAPVTGVAADTHVNEERVETEVTEVVSDHDDELEKNTRSGDGPAGQQSTTLAVSFISPSELQLQQAQQAVLAAQQLQHDNVADEELEAESTIVPADQNPTREGMETDDQDQNTNEQ